MHRRNRQLQGDQRCRRHQAAQAAAGIRRRLPRRQEHDAGPRFERGGIEGLDAVLEGTTAIAYSTDDYVSGAKILSKFAEDHKGFEIKAGFVDGGAVDSGAIAQLAKLPPKEQLLALVLGGLNAPISGFVTVLNGTLKGLVVALNAIAEKQAANA